MNPNKRTEIIDVSEETEKRAQWPSYIIYAVIMIGLPTLIGFIFLWASKETRFFEIFFILFGLFSLIGITFRLRSRDTKNYKKNKTIVEDKKSKSYKQFLAWQFVLLGVGLFDILVSLLCFFIL